MTWKGDTEKRALAQVRLVQGHEMQQQATSKADGLTASSGSDDGVPSRKYHSARAECPECISGVANKSNPENVGS